MKYTSQRRRVAKHKILKHERSKIKNRWQQRLFYIAIDGKHEAMMTFVFAGDKQIIIDHTEVNPGNEGKGFSTQLPICALTHYLNKNK